MKIKDIILKENDDLFSDKPRTPPKNIGQLFTWAQVDPTNRKDFLIVAKFGIHNQLTLKKTLETIQYFDEADDEELEHFGINYETALKLFNAYENICDAWNTDQSGEISTTDSWDDLDEAEVAEPPEPPRKTTTKTKTKPDVKFDPFQTKPDQPLANRPEEPKGADTSDSPTMRRASAASTRRAAGGVGATDQMRDMLSRMRDIEIDPDLAPYPDDEPTLDISTQVNTENLPTVAGEALQAAGVTSPEFHQVARLPGNMSQMIRQLGKVLFGSMTTTATEDIYMIGNLGGQGPNTRQEVNAVANWVRNHGDDLGPGDIDFDRVMPGYSAQTQQYVAAGVRWLLVKDFAGEYIYAWPESDSKTVGSQAQLGRESKRLGENEEDMFADPRFANGLPTAARIRQRTQELHDLGEMEPEEVYDQVADEFGIDIDELYDILGAD